MCKHSPRLCTATGGATATSLGILEPYLMHLPPNLIALMLQRPSLQQVLATQAPLTQAAPYNKATLQESQSCCAFTAFDAQSSQMKAEHHSHRGASPVMLQA